MIARLAIIGGGRWGRVHGSVAQAERIVTVAREGDYPTIEALLKEGVDAAIVANAARLHASSAMQLIEAGVHVLVEKPAAFSELDAGALVMRAQDKNVAVMPGLNFLYAGYLQHFAKKVEMLGGARSVALVWQDATGEERHGERKGYDAGVSVAMDVMPHVWSVLQRVVLKPWQIKGCELMRGGREAAFVLEGGGVQAMVALGRDCPARVRRLAVMTASGQEAVLDFTQEPGFIEVQGEREVADVAWADSPSPLVQQWQAFEACIAGEGRTLQEERLLASVAFAAAAEQMLCQQRDILLKRGYAELPREEALYLVREAMAEPLLKAGGYAPGDNETLTRYAETMLHTKQWPIKNEAALRQFVEGADHA